MNHHSSSSLIRSFLYGGGSILLLLNIILLGKAVITANYVPLIPIIAGVLTAAGLVLIIIAEQRAREEDKRSHRRIARVANQLTNPLHALNESFIQLHKNSAKLPPELRLKVKHMETKTTILLDNIRDVFLTLQAQEGPIAQDVRVYDLCSLLQESYERALPLASARNVELVFKTHCSHAAVNVDKRLFFIALAHIIENAINYTLTPGIANIAVVKNSRRARIIVQDRGIGISVDDAPNVFKPFARGIKAEKYDPNGIGIGLALSQLIIHECHGHLAWQNRKGTAGTQFEIHLPLTAKK